MRVNRVVKKYTDFDTRFSAQKKDLVEFLLQGLFYFVLISCEGS